jgi:hypothetical protein
MADTVSPPKSSTPCEMCGSTEHSTDRHYEGTGSPDGYHEDGSYPTTIGTEKVYENRPDRD